MLFLQVVFANNPISGILIFMVLTVADPLVSAAGLLTASVGLLVSIMVSAEFSAWALDCSWEDRLCWFIPEIFFTTRNRLVLLVLSGHMKVVN